MTWGFRSQGPVYAIRLARGLASRVEQLGVRIFERSPVTRIESGRAWTARGALRAVIVVRATEAYAARLRAHERAIVPLHSWMIATEPLPDATWKEIGLERAETFGDGRGITTYGQRTADGRIAFGGMGSYYYDSGIRSSFPAAHPGVAASNLAGRTLAELLAGERTERTELSLVAPFARDWEPEPLRWLAARGVLAAVAAADRATKGPARWRSWLMRAIAGR